MSVLTYRAAPLICVVGETGSREGGVNQRQLLLWQQQLV